MAKKIFRVLLLSVLFFAGESQAGTIHNMTEHTQGIVLIDRGAPVVIEIGPWSRYWEIGAFRAKYRNHEVYIEEDMEYAIWPGGVFGPQRVNRNLSRGGF